MGWTMRKRAICWSSKQSRNYRNYQLDYRTRKPAVARANISARRPQQPLYSRRRNFCRCLNLWWLRHPIIRIIFFFPAKFDVFPRFPHQRMKENIFCGRFDRDVSRVWRAMTSIGHQILCAVFSFRFEWQRLLASISMCLCEVTVISMHLILLTYEHTRNWSCFADLHFSSTNWFVQHHQHHHRHHVPLEAPVGLNDSFDSSSADFCSFNQSAAIDSICSWYIRKTHWVHELLPLSFQSNWTTLNFFNAAMEHEKGVSIDMILMRNLPIPHQSRIECQWESAAAFLK